MRIDSIVTAYDANNNAMRITETKFNALNGGITTDICEMEYDLLDRQTKNTQRGHEVNYVYDDNGNRKQVRSTGGITDYDYDGRNRLTTATTANGTSTYVYTGDSKKQSVSYPNNTVTTYTYDNADRVLSVLNKQGIGTLSPVISSFEYSYDVNSNRLTQVETQNGFAANQVQTTRYVYDNANRMTEYDIADHQSGQVSQFEYTFDANYNRVHEVQSVRSSLLSLDRTITKQQRSAFDANNRLTSITDELSLDNSDIAYLYDNNGNTLTKTDNTQLVPEVTTFAYDSRDQLTQVIRGPPGSQTNQGYYDYNYAGMRVRNLASERGDIEYIYDGSAVLEERNLSTSNLVAHYRYSDRLISLNTQTDEQYYHYSALRTTANLSNRSGDIQASYRSDVWGHITAEEGSSVNRQVFTGQEHDKNTGLIYFGARFYDPDTARFINEDSYLGESSTAPSLHRYLYAYANPTVYTDADGRSAVEELAPIAVPVLTKITLDTVLAGAAANSASFTGVAAPAVFSWPALFCGNLVGGTICVVVGSILPNSTTENDQIVPRLKYVNEQRELRSEFPLTEEQYNLIEIGIRHGDLSEELHKLDQIEKIRQAGYDRLKKIRELQARQDSNSSLVDVEAQAYGIEPSTTYEQSVSSGSNQVSDVGQSVADAPNGGVADEIAGIRNLGANNRAAKELHSKITLKGIESQTGAHFVSKHGPQTLMSHQYRRATTGQNPDGQAGFHLGRVGSPGANQASSRFNSWSTMLDSYSQAAKQFRGGATRGDTKQIVEHGSVIGHGYTKQILSCLNTKHLPMLYGTFHLVVMCLALTLAFLKFLSVLPQNLIDRVLV